MVHFQECVFPVLNFHSYLGKGFQDSNVGFLEIAVVTPLIKNSLKKITEFTITCLYIFAKCTVCINMTEIPI